MNTEISDAISCVFKFNNNRLGVCLMMWSLVMQITTLTKTSILLVDQAIRYLTSFVSSYKVDCSAVTGCFLIGAFRSSLLMSYPIDSLPLPGQQLANSKDYAVEMLRFWSHLGVFNGIPFKSIFVVNLYYLKEVFCE